MISWMKATRHGIKKEEIKFSLLECLPSVLLWITKNLERPKVVKKVATSINEFLS